MNALQQAWLAGVNVLAGIWDQVVDAADTAWDRILASFDGMISSIKRGLVGMLDLLLKDVLGPLFEKMKEFNSTLGIRAATAAGSVKKVALDARISLKQSIRDEEEKNAGSGPDSREGSREARQTARQAISDDARVERERQIEILRERQAELAKQSSQEAKQEQTANQKTLDASIAAAKAARDAAAENRLQESDFAVSQDVQSITRFSGEALGLSVGRGQDPAEKTAKLSADQLKELKDLRKDIQKSTREMLRLQAMGGFT